MRNNNEVRAVEAREFLCPMTLAGSQPRPCQGPLCMAWQWVGFVSPRFHVAVDRQATVEPERPGLVPETWVFQPHDPDDDGNAGWREPTAEALQRRRGRCGMAPVPMVTEGE